MRKCYLTLPKLGIQKVKGKSSESTEALLNRYRKNPFVEYAEPNTLFHLQLTPNDPRYNELYGLHNTGQSGGLADADIDAPEAWDLQTGSSTVIVADIDTGVDYNHPDLAANMWTNPGETAGNGIDDDSNGKIDDVRGWDFVNNDNDPFDDHGHGTHTSGTIAAVGNNSVGVVGVSWQAKIMPLKFLNASGSGTLEAAAAAIIYAADMGAKISSNSWGCGPSGGCFSQTLEDAIAYANSKGMLFIVAAGNSNGNNNDTIIFYPCTSSQSNVICVAATDRNDLRASFSNIGATTVDLGAAGVAILSTVPTGTCSLCDSTGYLALNGTSMATPHVAGAAALLLSHFPTSTINQIKSRILSNVDSITALSGVTVTGGRLNIDKALRAGNPLVAPTNLTAVDRPADSGGAINLAWTPSTSTGITQQRVYRSTTSGGPYSLIITFNNNTTSSHTDTGLTDGTRYYYVVRAFNGTVESANSNEASAIPANNSDITAPVISNVSANNISASGATITWTTNEASDSQVEYGPTTSYGSSSPLNTAAVTSHNMPISSLSPSTLYHYRVKSRDAAGNLAVSSDFTFTTLPSSTNPDSWTTKAQMPTMRSGLAAGVINDRLYAVGGLNGGIAQTLEEYNPSTNTWTAKASMSTGRYIPSAGVINGILYVVGGSDGGFFSSMEAYNPSTNTWSNKASMPTARYGMGVGVVNGILYAVGGYNNNYLSTVEAYDPSTNTWSTKTSMPTARAVLVTEVINNVLYAVGGGTGFTAYAVTEAYDPVANSWTTKTSMPTARWGAAGGVINNKLYVVGGYNTFYLQTLEEYTPPPAWTLQTVDGSGGVQFETSLALDSSGNPRISYKDSFGNQAEYAQWNGTSWTSEAVSAMSGQYHSLALDSAGNPHISYWNAATLDLVYAKKTGGSWSFQTVDSTGSVGQHTSLAIDSNGNPHISYVDHSNITLKYAKWNGSSWVIQTVDSIGIAGFGGIISDTSIALDSGDNPRISYYHSTNKDLKYAEWNGSSWVIQTIDSGGDVGLYNFLALNNNTNPNVNMNGNGHPHISYYDATNSDLKYATWNGSSWSIQVVDSIGLVGTGNSITLDNVGHPHISYGDLTNGNIKYSRWNGSSWSTEMVDLGGGSQIGIKIDNAGRIHISYLYSRNLKYAIK